MKITKHAVFFSLLFLFSVRAAAQTDFPPLSPDTNPYMDPAFQDYVETVYGYRNPKNAPKVINDFRDALTSIPSVNLKTVRPPDSAAARRQDSAADNTVPGRPRIPALSEKAPGQYYKVTFANEAGPLSAYVNPLDPNAVSGFKAADYVFVTVLPGTEDHAAVIRAISGMGFRFAGEKTYFSGGEKKTFLLGWAPYSKLESISNHPQVRRAAIEKKISGVPFRTRIRFTLRAPGGTLSGVFVSDFIRRLSAGTGFASENVFRLPQNAANAKFTAYDVIGSLPVDMVGELSRSPFVAAVELLTYA